MSNEQKTFEELNQEEIFDLIVLEKEIAILEGKLEELSQKKDILAEKMLVEMKKADCPEYENEEIKIKYHKPSERKGVDTKLLETKYPEVYSECKKVISVKERISVKLK